MLSAGADDLKAGIHISTFAVIQFPQFEKKAHYGQIDKRIDRPTDQPTDGRTDPHIKMHGRI